MSRSHTRRRTRNTKGRLGLPIGARPKLLKAPPRTIRRLKDSLRAAVAAFDEATSVIIDTRFVPERADGPR